jgi:hypothetical protein
MFHVMYSTYKNIILKRLKYLIAGILLIIILPGNAGDKNYRHFNTPYPDSHIPGNVNYFLRIDNQNKFKTLKENTEDIPGKTTEKSDDAVNHYQQKAREMSPTGKSFNFLLSFNE